MRLRYLVLDGLEAVVLRPPLHPRHRSQRLVVIIDFALALHDFILQRFQLQCLQILLSFFSTIGLSISISFL